MEAHEPGDEDYKVNEYVKCLVSVVEEAAQLVFLGQSSRCVISSVK
jgi:hypothetical protein